MAIITGTTNSDNLVGGADNDHISGLAGNDTISSSAGLDTLAGGTGNDTYVIDATGGDDVISELDGEGTDTVEAKINYTLGATSIENLVLVLGGGIISGTGNALNNTISAIGVSGSANMNGGEGNDTLYGGRNADTLQGGNGIDVLDESSGDGDDLLDGGSGADIMKGGKGYDTYVVDDNGDQVQENASEGVDTVKSSITYTLGLNVDNLSLQGSTAIDGTGNALANVLIGNTGNNRLAGLDGADDLRGGAGDDTLQGGNGTDILRGSAGADRLEGGAGDDLYIIEADGVDDVIVELDGEGIDTVNVNVSYAMGATSIENLVIGASGGATASGTGNALGNTMTAVGFGAVVLDGADGNDTLYGGRGNDTLKGGSGNDTLIDTGTDTADTLDGGLGADVMKGGKGNDQYFVDDAGDVVQENAPDGYDTVYSTVSHDLAANVEALYLTGTQAINGGGNELGNYMVGNDAANILHGGEGSDALSGGAGNDILYGDAGDDALYASSGADQLIGGQGNDIYYIDASGASNVIVEASGEGIDTVWVTGNYALNGLPDVENITLAMSSNATYALTGNASDNNLTTMGFGYAKLDGGAGNDTLVGSNNNDTLLGGAGQDMLTDISGSGDDSLDGGTGADTMRGGKGNDTYVVDETADVIVEFGNEGWDTVQSSASYTLAGNLESLTLTGNLSVNGTGNSSDNVLMGNALDNVLDGAAGADKLFGGEGNDTYVIDGQDTVTESANSGTDTVRVNFSYTLGNNLENLTLTGNSAIDGTGNALNNVLTGNSAANVLKGGLGNDSYVIDNLDTVTEFGSEGTDTVLANFSHTLGANLENLTLTGGSAINGTGNELNNVLTGNIGNNTLNGGAGADVLAGGAGHDTYVIDNLDTVNEAAGAGTDTVQANFTYTLGVNLENLTLTGSSAINGTGNELNNVLTGNSAVNTLKGGLGNDTYVVDSLDTVTELAGEGTDTVQANFNYTLGLNIENLTLTGSSAINGTGNELNNVLTGNSAGNALKGGLGNDTYVVDSLDTVTELAGEGTDTVQANFNYTLGLNIENLTLTGSGAINGTGNELNNVLTGNSGNNTLNGGAGADVLAGGVGNDTYVVDSLDTVNEAASAGTDTVQANFNYTLGLNLENLTLTGSSTITGTGNELNNVLTGNSAANTLRGGLGNDTYVVDSLDAVTELAGEGTDTVQANFNYTLGLNLENLTLTGSSAITGTGNDLNNVLTGNSAVNTLKGGKGHDTYVIDSLDTVTELAGEGTDTVQANFNYTLGLNIENLTLTGSGAINGTGNELNNVLTGNSGNNTLNGGVGADVLAGGAGHDTYVIDNLDTINEAAGAGTDTVQANFNYTLGLNLENLTLTGTSAITGTGNDLNNVLAGNSAANELKGGKGNDTYVIDNLDAVTELAGEGTDTVQASFNYTLGLNVENLALTGNSAIDGTGNELNNVLTGNSAANTLKGGLGHDTYVVDSLDNVTEIAGEGTDTVLADFSYTLGLNLENLTLTGASAINGTGNVLDNTLTGNSGANALQGGAGNDTYVIDGQDTVTELANEGTDTVQTSATYSLGVHVENLTLLGSGAADATGNELHNVLTGNAGANTLIGGTGNDTLIGGAGNDLYKLGRGDGADTLLDQDASAGNVDQLLFGADIAANQLWFRHTGNDLEVNVIGTADKVTIQNWYLSTDYQLERFQSGEGKFLQRSQVEVLVAAMATMTPPAAGQTTLPTNYQDAIGGIIATAWQ